MKVYICYDRYEHNEWFSVYSIGTDRDEMIRKCKEEDLPSFIEYGPDDCHSFQLVEVKLTKKQYEQLLKWDNDGTQSLESYGDKSSDYYNFMYDLYNDQYETETIISTDGCSDFYEIVKYYSVMYKNKDVEEVDDIDWLYSDECEEYQEELLNDEELSGKVIREYILDTY
jgi:hypothetical protein